MKTVEFKNPVCRGADPWMFVHDGYYYLCCTAGSVIRLFRSKDPSKIHDETESENVIAFAPREGEMWSKNLWSPEIHYFSPEDFGESHAGWYMFVACDDGFNVNHRMYVLKCEDLSSPFAAYGNPITGERFVPEKVVSPTDEHLNDGWRCGQTLLRHKKDVYCMWVDEVGRQTPEFHQRIRIAKMINPYTAGEAHVMCRPTEEWEMHGYGANKEGKIHPKVVEGGTAIYGDDGKIYVIYSGSGYWTKYYALGHMVLDGDDPADENCWTKDKDPIFSMSDEVFGCGHASYFFDAAGKRYICYHAYLSPDRTGGRYVFIEPYKIENGRVIIGDGSLKPAPLDTVQTITTF
ncbi:MAG: hypothetical protein E7598_02025 [Ruminococcaceae bacterium]|nr:hypothetical protein [Oscillospiraceae bacterium]